MVRPILTSAQAYGPTSGKATATGAEGVTYTKFKFLATPAAGGTGIPSDANQPEAWWYNLTPNTKYIVSVIGVQADGQEMAAANTLPMTTPAAGTPNIASTTANSPTTATIVLNAPPGTVPTYYEVKLCSEPALTQCVTKRCPTIICPFDALTPNTIYKVTCQAFINGKLVPASNSLPLQMPGAGSPTLVTAQAAGSRTGAATAAPPKGVTFDRYVFTARPLSGGPSATSDVAGPLLGKFTGLTPATQYEVKVVGYKNGVASPASNILFFVTPADNAPANTGQPTSPNQAIITVVPPSIPPPNGGTWTSFIIKICPIRGPAASCFKQTCTSIKCTVKGLSPLTTYNTETTAVSPSGDQSPPSTTDSFTTPGAIP